MRLRRELSRAAGPSRLSSTQAGTAALTGHPLVRAGDWVRRFGYREEPEPLAVAPRPSGVPAREERGLLVRLREVGPHLGEAVQAVEPADVGLVTRVDNV